MEDERFYWLIGRVNAGDITDDQLNELFGLIEQDPELRSVYEVLTLNPEIESAVEAVEAMKAYTVHYAKMQLAGHLDYVPSNQSTDQIEAPKRNARLKMWILPAIAASLVLGVLVFFFTPKQDKHNAIVYSSKKGVKNKLVLPDGTKVWLNADSKLTLAKQFGNSATREVNLSGEAYFEVAHDKKHPFIISANAIKVKVLGTVFNLKAYPEDKDTETTLIEGSVEVSIDGQSSSRITLKPGEKLKVHNDKNTTTTTPKSMVKATTLLTKTSVPIENNKAIESLWTEDKLVFDGEPFENVANELGRWYNKNIIIEDEGLKYASFTATFENKSLTQVLTALQFTTKFRYRIVEDVVYIEAAR